MAGTELGQNTNQQLLEKIAALEAELGQYRPGPKRFVVGQVVCSPEQRNTQPERFMKLTHAKWDQTNRYWLYTNARVPANDDRLNGNGNANGVQWFRERDLRQLTIEEFG